MHNAQFSITWPPASLRFLSEFFSRFFLSPHFPYPFHRMKMSKKFDKISITRILFALNARIPHSSHPNTNVSARIWILYPRSTVETKIKRKFKKVANLVFWISWGCWECSFSERVKGFDTREAEAVLLLPFHTSVIDTTIVCVGIVISTETNRTQPLCCWVHRTREPAMSNEENCRQLSKHPM